MADLQTIVPYALSDYEEAAYLLSKYFIQRGYNADIRPCKETEGGYSAIISREGFLKNFLGSRTTIEVTFYPIKYSDGQNLPQNVDSGQNPPQNVGGGQGVLPQSAGVLLQGSGADKPIKNKKRQNPDKKGQGGNDSGNKIAGSGIKISGIVVTDGAVKEIITYITVIPAIRKFSDYISMLRHAKRRSLIICEKLRVSGSISPHLG